MGENFTSGFVPLAVNPTRVIEVKILNSINAGNGSGGGGGGGGGGGLVGSGSPQNVKSAAAGTTYLDTSTNNFWVNTNGAINGWTELIGN